MTHRTDQTVPLPLRSYTFLGVCEAIGEDFGFNPNYLRVPLGAIVVFNIWAAVGAYLALGAGRAGLAAAVPGADFGSAGGHASEPANSPGQPRCRGDSSPA